MSNNHILICKSILGATAEWRRRVLLTHPSDHRNTTAAELLEHLSVEPVSAVPADLATQLDNYSDTELSREAKLAAKLVGFKSFPGTLSSFVTEVIDRIDQNRLEWESAFHTKSEGER
jgi:hypothetical protein